MYLNIENDSCGQHSRIYLQLSPQISEKKHTNLSLWVTVELRIVVEIMIENIIISQIT